MADVHDALRFHWIKERVPNQIETLRFTRLVFGLVQSPFILGGTLQEHLGSYIEKYPTEVAEIKDDLCVHDLISGGNNFKQVASLKDIAIGQVDSPESLETPETTEKTKNFIKVTKYLTKLKEAPINHIWEKSAFKKR